MQAALPPRLALLLPVVALLLAAVALAGVAGYVHWIHRDAVLRGSEHASLWAVAAFLSGPLVLLYYLPNRPRPRQAPDPPSAVTKALASIGAGLWVSFVLGATFAPPDPVTQVVSVTGSLVVTAPLAYVLIFLVAENPGLAA